ncbi:unnamed protein product [Adineta steineri]|uniref:RING-type domain-containing protein n=1 Tax=Adineta steineri TaxID=433720 RepID=A0A815QU94_9BILA|nr:unnamed protein product [Adineta steineri]CAF1466951.1 unnamed protein product [Adineta steineri]
MLDTNDICFEEGGIDTDRIVTDKLRVADELFCLICKNLLWKARSCASCQHLFCNKCIRTWLTINSTSCPLRCSPYEEKRVPPSICSLLSRLTIRCRNSSLGCTKVLSYDLLEKHETDECQFRTKQCFICGKYIKINEFDRHQKSCKLTTLTCHVCKCLVNRESLEEHAKKCILGRLHVLLDQTVSSWDIPKRPGTVPVQQENKNMFTRLNNRVRRFVLSQRKIRLAGFNVAKRARHKNYWIRIWTMFQLILLNKSRASQIICCLLFFAIGTIIPYPIILFSLLRNQIEMFFYRSLIFMILFVGLFSFAFTILLTYVNDIWIIMFIFFALLLVGSIRQEMPIEYFQVNQSRLLMLATNLVLLCVLKLSLLLIRFYFLYIPTYISTSCLASTIIFLTFYMRYFSNHLE